jgi:flagellar biosynthetic protein FliQ
MNPEFAADTLKTMIFLAIMIAAPFLLAAMLIGLGVGLFQAVTSIHEQTLTFVPKALGISGLLVLLLPWIMRKLIEFCTALIERMPQMVGG